MDIKKEVQDNAILVTVCSNDYQKILIDTLQQIEKQFNTIAFISLNKPYINLIEVFKENNINLDKFFFIDAITSTVKKPNPEKNCIFISSPNALTELSITINKTAKVHNFNFLLFDSLSSLLIYEKGPIVIKFIHSLINNLRTNKMKIDFIILKGDVDSALMKDLSMFADKIIYSGDSK